MSERCHQFPTAQADVFNLLILANSIIFSLRATANIHSCEDYFVLIFAHQCILEQNLFHSKKTCSQMATQKHSTPLYYFWLKYVVYSCAYDSASEYTSRAAGTEELYVFNTPFRLRVFFMNQWASADPLLHQGWKRVGHSLAVVIWLSHQEWKFNWMIVVWATEATVWPTATEWSAWAFWEHCNKQGIISDCLIILCLRWMQSFCSWWGRAAHKQTSD